MSTKQSGAYAKTRRETNLGRLLLLERSNREGFAHWINRYLEWLAIHNYAKLTVKLREATLVRFAMWCRARGMERPQEVTKPVLERYQKHLFERRKKSNDRALNFRTQASNLGSLRVFFAWLTRQNALLWNPASELELPRIPDRLPRAVLNITEVETVLAAIDVSSAIGLRDRAMIETFYSTGIRRTELVSLLLTDLDAERGLILIRAGKGGKDRMVPVGARAVHWIDAYLEKARPELVVNTKEATLFLNRFGAPINPGSCTNLVRTRVEAASLGKSGACHMFRHTMATLMLEGGADVRFIQQMLGHVNLSTTEIYTRVAIRMLKAVHEATHPARFDQSKTSADVGPRFPS